MNQRQMKYENPARLQELAPEQTLQRIGLKPGQVCCEIGAGSGIFAVPAAKLTGSLVLALEISEEMLEILAEKARLLALPNLKPVLVKGERFSLDDHSVDLALMVTVLHEIASKAALLDELKRLVKPGGRTAIIEFHKSPTPMGPPVGHRIGCEEVVSLFTSSGWDLADEFDLGSNFYCLTFRLNTGL